MTKKDYEKIAKILNRVINTQQDEIESCIDGWLDATVEIADKLCVLFKEDNPKFDRSKFLKACDIID